MNHDVTIDSDASIRGMPPPVSSRPQGPPPTVPVRPTPEQQRIIQLETMVNTLQARLDAAPDRARVPDPMTTPETLVTLLNKLSIETKSSKPTPRAPEAKPVDLMPLEHMKDISKLKETSLEDLKLQIEREEQRHLKSPQDIPYLSSLQKRYINRITDLRTKQDKLKVIERTSTQTTATGLPLPAFTKSPVDYKRQSSTYRTLLKVNRANQRRGLRSSIRPQTSQSERQKESLGNVQKLHESFQSTCLQLRML